MKLFVAWRAGSRVHIAGQPQWSYPVERQFGGGLPGVTEIGCRGGNGSWLCESAWSDYARPLTCKRCLRRFRRMLDTLKRLDPHG